MKAMFLIDFFVARQALAKWTALCVPMIAVAYLLVGPNPWIAVFTGYLVPYVTVKYLFYADGLRGWQRLRLALPLSRADVVNGRYAFVAALVAGSAGLGLGLYALSLAASGQFPAVVGLVRYPIAFDASAAPLALALCLALPLGALALMMPVAERFGYARAGKWVFAAFLLVLVVLPWLTSPAGGPAFFAPAHEALARVAASPAGACKAAALALVLSCALYAGSAAFARRLYARREF